MSDSGGLSARYPTMCSINSDLDCNLPSGKEEAVLVQDITRGKIPGFETSMQGKARC